MLAQDWNDIIITDWDEIYSKSFQDKWHSWIENAVDGHVFIHPSLCMAWIEAYRPLRKMDAVFIISSNAESTVFLPLVIIHKNWKNSFIKSLEPVGCGDFDYHDPLFAGKADQDIINSYWQHFFNRILLNLFSDADQIIISGIRKKGLGDIWKIEHEGCPFSDLRQIKSENALLASLSTSLRGDINRQMRRLESSGELSYHEYSFNSMSGTFDYEPDRFLNAHTNRWPNSFKAPGFHQLLINETVKAGVGHFSELRLNGNAISWHLGFIWKNKYYYYMPAINQDYFSFSPGKLHLFKLAVTCINNGIEFFDFLKGQEDYKNQWAAKTTNLYYYKSVSGSTVSRIKNFIGLNLKNKFIHNKQRRISGNEINVRLQNQLNCLNNDQFRVKRLTSWDEIYSPDFQNIWSTFYNKENTNHVFFHPALSTAWIDTYRKIRDLTPLFYLFELKNKRMLIPLVIWRKNWRNVHQTVIKPLGFNDFDYADPVSTGNFRKYDFVRIWEAILSDIEKNFNHDLINISGIHNNGSFRLPDFRKTEDIHLIDIKEYKEINGFLDHLNPKHYKEIKRRYKRLGELGKLEVVHLRSSDIGEALTELEQMLKIHKEHWPKAYKAPGFHENLLNYGLRSGVVHFSVIRLNGYSISWRIGFILNRHYYSYMPAYRPEYKKFSPGTLHLLACIKYAIENGCAVYDLLKGTETYKKEWASREEHIGGIIKQGKKAGSILRNALIEMKNGILHDS